MQPCLPNPSPQRTAGNVVNVPPRNPCVLQAESDRGPRNALALRERRSLLSSIAAAMPLSSRSAGHSGDNLHILGLSCLVHDSAAAFHLDRSRSERRPPGLTHESMERVRACPEWASDLFLCTLRGEWPGRKGQPWAVSFSALNGQGLLTRAAGPHYSPEPGSLDRCSAW